MITKNYSFFESKYYGYGNKPDNLYRIRNRPVNQQVYVGKASDLNDMYNKQFTKDFDLSKMKKVFFDPNCTYPRYKLAQFTNVKRCLSPDKADAVIITLTKFQNEYSKYYMFYSAEHDHYYFVQEYDLQHRNTLKDEYPSIPKQEDRFIKYVIDKKMTADDLTYVGIREIVFINEDDAKSVNVLKGTHKFILDTDLDAEISKTLNNADESDIESIDELLGSSDISTVGLGMDLLINYNVTEKACTIGMMIFKHRKNIIRSPKINSVGFKNILSALKITRSDLNYYNENGKLHYINKLYKIATNPEDKTLAYKMAVSIVQKQLEDSLQSLQDGISNLGIKADIRAY